MKTLIGKYKELVELQDKLTDILLSGWNNEDNQTPYPEDLERKIKKIESEIAELEQNIKTPSDQDIENAACDYASEINKIPGRDLIITKAYIHGAKDMRDNNIYVAPQEKHEAPVKQPKYRKIPIIITKYDDGVKGWRAEISDNYENYKPARYDEINFEDLGFHFHHDEETHPNDPYVFLTRKSAIEAAEYCNEKYLNGKAKIWIIR